MLFDYMRAKCCGPPPAAEAENVVHVIAKSVVRDPLEPSSHELDSKLAEDLPLAEDPPLAEGLPLAEDLPLATEEIEVGFATDETRDIDDVPPLQPDVQRVRTDAGMGLYRVNTGRTDEDFQASPSLNSKDAEVDIVGTCDDVEEFEVVMTKAEAQETIGVDVLEMRRRLVVATNGEAGIIKRWNAEHPEQRVKYGAVVLDVNGVSSDMESMMQECKNCGTVKMKVQRCRRYTVFVPDKKEKLGIDLHPQTMEVRAILTSAALKDKVALATWNLTCDEGMEILPGDVLVEINGQSGTPEQMLRLIRKTEGELRLGFMRT